MYLSLSRGQAHKRREHTHEMAQELHQQGEGARRVGDQNKQEVYTMTERMIFALFPVLGNGFFIMWDKAHREPQKPL